VKPTHARIVNGMDSDVQHYIEDYFAAPPHLRPLSVGLAEVGAGQADVVLALIRADEARCREAAERLIGHRIMRCPPCLRPRAPLENPDRVFPPDQRRFTRVAPNARKPNTGAHCRFAILKPGMTVEQFLIRGGTRRDLRIALERGLVEMEAA
jgi:hypothetical protein